MKETLDIFFKQNNLLMVAKKYSKNSDLAGDMVSELYLYLLSKNEDFIKQMYNDGVLFKYSCKILYYSWNSPTSPFYIKYKSSKTVEINENIIKEAEDLQRSFDSFFWIEKIDEKEKEIIKKKNRFPVETRLLSEYIKLKSCRAVGKELNISYRTVAHIIKQIVEEIKNENISHNKS